MPESMQPKKKREKLKENFEEQSFQDGVVGESGKQTRGTAAREGRRKPR